MPQTLDQYWSPLVFILIFPEYIAAEKNVGWQVLLNIFCKQQILIPGPHRHTPTLLNTKLKPRQPRFQAETVVAFCRLMKTICKYYDSRNAYIGANHRRNNPRNLAVLKN